MQKKMIKKTISKHIFAFIGLLMMVLVPSTSMAQAMDVDLDVDDMSPGGFKRLICLAVDLANIIVTPLPIADKKTDTKAIVTVVEAGINTTQSLSELIQYLQKMLKLSKNAVSLAQDAVKTKVTEIKNVVKGTETMVDGFKGSVPGISSNVVDFKKAETTQNAIAKVAVVANPVTSAEELAAIERRDAFIQQAWIDLLSDILVAKKKLADLKASDSSMQGASSTGDTNGNTYIVIRAKNFENQVQTLEENLASMRIVLEGLKSLKAAGTVKDGSGIVGGSK